MRSPIVELNRAVAVGMAFGAAAGLQLVDRLLQDPALVSYHYVASVRADLLEKVGRFAEAQDEYRRAASMTRNVRERALLLARADRLRLP